MIGRSGERWSEISVLTARHDDDDDDDVVANDSSIFTAIWNKNELSEAIHAQSSGAGEYVEG